MVISRVIQYFLPRSCWSLGRLHFQLCFGPIARDCALHHGTSELSTVVVHDAEDSFDNMPLAATINGTSCLPLLQALFVGRDSPCKGWMATIGSIHERTSACHAE
eukprot:3358751-Amphidinium_carterae.1